jgi:4-hydroxybenzoate polyprenyltransferase
MSRYFALSRTTHGLLDMAGPAFCALLWLGDFPAWWTIALSLLTAFAAYTSIYALNDLLGIQCDKEKFAGSKINAGYGVEASSQRHPLARGLLSVRSGLIWAGAWFILALIGSYLLNPAIVVVLLVAAGLEVVYCLLQTVTYLRTLVSGLVKTSGPVAAVLVVDHNPEPALLLLLAGWVFFWEIGGQNIPSDWNYAAEDQRAGAATIPLRFGLRAAGLVILLALAFSVVASGFLPSISPAPLGGIYLLISLLFGFLLLLVPGYELYRSTDVRLAARLFDRASYYPLSQFVLIAVFLIVAKALRG